MKDVEGVMAGITGGALYAIICKINKGSNAKLWSFLFPFIRIKEKIPHADF